VERFCKDKKTLFLKTRIVELLHLHQHGEYVNKDSTRDNRENGGDARARAGMQPSGHG